MYLYIMHVYFFHTLQATPWYSRSSTASFCWSFCGSWEVHGRLVFLFKRVKEPWKLSRKTKGKVIGRNMKKHINSKCMNLSSYRILKHEIFIYHFCSRWITNRFHLPLFLFLQILSNALSNSTGQVIPYWNFIRTWPAACWIFVRRFAQSWCNKLPPLSWSWSFFFYQKVWEEIVKKKYLYINICIIQRWRWFHRLFSFFLGVGGIILKWFWVFMSSARDNVQRNLRSEDLIISSYDYDASRNIYCLYMYIYRKHISLYTFAHIILGRTRRAFKKKNDSLFFQFFLWCTRVFLSPEMWFS